MIGSSRWPSKFLERIKTQLGTEYDAFLDALGEPSPISVRFNPAKPANHNLSVTDRVPWCQEGVYLAQRPVFSIDPLWHGGAYYVQEASSMILHEVLRDFFTGPPKLVLDAAASPGGKSTLIAALMRPEDLLICNEIHPARFQILNQNLAHWGAPNVWLGHEDTKLFTNLEGLFDLILLDAPCSGEGMFRKDEIAVQQWTESLVELCANRQQNIIKQLWPALRTGGLFLYSTCTYAPDENENNMTWALRNNGAQIRHWSFPDQWNIKSLEQGYQIWPHQVKGEGFFFCGFVKTSEGIEKRNKTRPLQNGFRKKAPFNGEEYLKDQNYLFLEHRHQTFSGINAMHKSWWEALSPSLPSLRPLLEVGQIKGDDFIPSPVLALSTELNSKLSRVEVDMWTAQKYLARQELSITIEPGWKLITHAGLGLGWIKGLSQRVNNYYPKDWRIYNIKLLDQKPI